MPDHSLPQLAAVPLSFSDAEGSGLIYIEQFQKGAESDQCTARNRPFLLAINDSTKKAVLFRPTCKTWNCPACGPVNRNRWIARAIHGVSALQAASVPVDFLTLTSHEKLRGAASFRVFPASWKKLHARWRYAVPEADTAAYLAVPERHQDGTLHTHAIITGGLPRRWWKDNARACGMGYMADVQEVADLGVGGYVGKYLGKTLGEAWPKNKRRVNTSRTWPKLPEMPEPEGWRFRKLPNDRPVNELANDYGAQGYDLLMASPGSAWEWLDELG